MDVLDKIYDMVCCELEEISKAQKLDMKDVELIDKFVDIIKDIEEMGIGSVDYGYDGGRSNRSMPTYNRGYRRSYGHSMNKGYTRDESKDMMLDHLQEVMDMAVDEKDRKAVERLMSQMQSN